ncbi:hypothetical protein [Actinophytocola sp.]|uniref:hypothetical protein n=1 Tax=Actinophytocola sp. TaxID=1872138 RepID=UPI00389AEB19
MNLTDEQLFEQIGRQLQAEDSGLVTLRGMRDWVERGSLRSRKSFETRFVQRRQYWPY